MGTTISMFIFAGLFVVVVFICSRLHDKLLKERTTAKNLREELNKAQNDVDWWMSRYDEVNRGFMKKSHQKDALQKDYDLLLCDYHTLEQEIEQYYDSKKEK